MIDAPHFILSGFWVFVGTLLMISTLGQAVARIVAAVRK